MKKLLLLSVILMAVAAVVSATPLPCLGATNIAALIATNGAGGCTSQGVTFSNFAYTGGGSKAAAQILATLVVQDTPGLNGDGWSFGPVGGWTTGFHLSFTVSITTKPDSGSFFLNQTVDQIFAGLTGSTNHTTASDTEPGVTPNPLVTLATSPGGETAQSNTYSLKSIASSTIVTIPSGRGVSNYEEVFYNNAIPEPVTFLLIGSGLLGLAFLRRRSLKG